MAAVVVDFNANVARFSSALDRATNDLNKFQSNASRMSGNLSKSFAGLGAALGGALSVAAFAGWIKGSIDAADELSKLAQKTGTAVEELAGLKFAADQNGTSLEAVANAAKKLSAAIVDNPDTFRKFGITAKDSTGALIQLADIFAGMPDGVEKTALAVKLMGKSGEEMIPFLNQGSAALAELTAQGKLYNPINAENAKQAALFKNQLAALKVQANGLGVTIATDLLPAMTEITTAMSLAAKEGGLLKAVWVGLGGVGAALFTGEFDDAAQKIVKLRGELGDLERHREQTLPGRGGFLQKWLYGTTAEIDGRIAATKKSIADLQAQIDKPTTAPKGEVKQDGRGGAMYSALGGGSSKGKVTDPFKLENEAWVREKEFQIAQLEEAAKRQTELQHDMTSSALAAQAIYANVDPIYKASLAWEEYMVLVEGGYLDLATAGQAYAKEFTEKTDKTLTEAEKSFERFTENVQKNFGDILFNSLDKGFKGIGDAFSDMTKRMLAEAAAANLTKALFGEKRGEGFLGQVGGSIANFFAPSFADGGFTGSGSRSGGIDGIGGFPAVLHPNETVIDHSKGQSAGGASVTVIQNISIDSRSDQSSIMGAVMRAKDMAKAEIMDSLQRGGQFAQATGRAR